MEPADRHRRRTRIAHPPQGSRTPTIRLRPRRRARTREASPEWAVTPTPQGKPFKIIMLYTKILIYLITKQ